MILPDPKKLAQYVRALPDFVVYKTIDGNYNHIGATVADAVLQSNMRYATHVKPRVNRILFTYPKARTTSAVLRLLETMSSTEFLNGSVPDLCCNTLKEEESPKMMRFRSSSS